MRGGSHQELQYQICLHHCQALMQCQSATSICEILEVIPCVEAAIRNWSIRFAKAPSAEAMSACDCSIPRIVLILPSFESQVCAQSDIQTSKKESPFYMHAKGLPARS